MRSIIVCAPHIVAGSGALAATRHSCLEAGTGVHKFASRPQVWLFSFMTTSMMFVFYAIVEFAVVNSVMQLEDAAKRARTAHSTAVAAAHDGPEVSAAGTTKEAGVATTTTVNAVRVEMTPSPAVGLSLGDCLTAEFGWSTPLAKVLLRVDATVRVRAGDIDTFHRFVYPVAYAVALGVLFSRTPSQ